jgi:chromosome segregation ATPase
MKYFKTNRALSNRIEELEEKIETLKEQLSDKRVIIEHYKGAVKDLLEDKRLLSDSLCNIYMKEQVKKEE